MSHNPIHILHLTGQWLRWVKIQPGASPQVLDSGTCEGPPERTLEQWADAAGDRRAHIALYDARPIYYSFSVTLPTGALKQKDKILRLRMAQEVGLAEDSVFWSAHTRSAHGEAPGQSEVFMTVVRRDAMDDVVAWRERRRLTHLWVGPDLAAIRALLAHAALPLVMVNADPCGVTLYHTNSQHQIMKERIDKHTPLRPDLGWNGSTGRMHFGKDGAAGLFDRYPSLGALPQVANDQLHRGGTPGLSAVAPAVLKLDAVLLGGVLDHATGAPPAEDLLRIVTPPPLEVILEGMTLARLSLIASLLVAGLGFVGFHTVKSARIVRENLTVQAQAISPSVHYLQAQETILRRVKSDRKQIIPVFEAIHKAVPAGVTLKSLNIGELGSLALAGTCRTPEAPNEFVFGMAQSPLLDRVVLKDQKTDLKTRIVSFQIMGHVKGRGK